MFVGSLFSLFKGDVAPAETGAFVRGQRVQFGSWWKPIQGEIVSLTKRDAQGRQFVSVRYYDDPAHFGHPVPFEVEVALHHLRPLA